MCCVGEGVGYVGYCVVCVFVVVDYFVVGECGGMGDVMCGVVYMFGGDGYC